MKTVWKILIPIGAVLTTYGIISCAIFFGLIASIGSNTVVETAYSPDGKMYAELINSDQGALGGDTIIKVYKVNSFDIFRNGETVYIGEWGKFEYLDLSWEDNDTLLVYNSRYDTYKEFDID